MSGNMLSEGDIFRVAKEVGMACTQARTLTHCLFWSQKASHSQQEMPIIWKTGREIGDAVGVHHRTANSHLKDLAARGFWSISYAPRPLGISNVTWLTFTQKSLNLLVLARELAEAPKKAKKATTIQGYISEHSNVHKTDLQGSQKTSSKKTQIKDKTAEKTGSFILSGQAGKKGMKEPFPAKKYTGPKTVQKKPPSYVKVEKTTEELANLISDVWRGAGLKDWDWTSAYAWRHCDEIAAKFSKRDITVLSERRRYIEGILENWTWMRICMEYRYSSHETNFLRPSAMALAHEFDRILDKLDEKWAPKVTQAPSDWGDVGF